MTGTDPESFATPLALASRVLVVDHFGQQGMDGLRSAGCDAIFNPLLSSATMERAVCDLEPDILVARSTKISSAVLHASERLGLIICTGANTAHVDVDAASARGIFVAHCPGRSACAVAELAWTLILGCDRQLPDQVIALRGGIWKGAPTAESAGMAGRTLGIVGLGQVGQEIAKRGAAFGMHIVAWSRNITEERCDALGIDFCANLVNLAKLSDVVSVSVTASEESVGLLGEKFFHALRPGATVINTSLGGVVDVRALLNAVRAKGIRAGIDLHAYADSEADQAALGELLKEPGVYGTMQSGAMTAQARDAVDQEVVRVIRHWLQNGIVTGCVNRTLDSGAVTLIHVRHLNRPGVLATIFEVIGKAGINVEEMENVICAGGDAAIARIHLNAPPTEGALATIRQAAHVLGVTVQAVNRSIGATPSGR
ncbi:MAG: hydroxyacid dehydrogenase [Phycisphaerales bacterium]|nr:hydroxyacid dehydrogenase [Phycisphaerales bacterium]